ncbi:hypothetical protein AB2L28_09445 [Kineococcus sp. TBRC 1896]|uniref:Restriction endonuclease domain-containing protein n=1 Tax=Kineococcus mangrovi TaxID=1660183 RepID=A0ABV4I1A7_9ACTN
MEFESPGDETWAKVPFCFERGVGEVWVVTPQASSVQVLSGPDRAVEHSEVLGVGVSEVAVVLGWR